MSCGLKKQQQNNEGGVHLTERTCSPYNPIIKQIVDDCLGLPIYPVSSIDAVIDEDGNTLRKILDELTDEIKGGTSDIQTLIENIQNKFELYLSKTEFNTFVSSLNNDFTKKKETEILKSLLWAISALSDINTLNEGNLYALDGKTPTIVDAVKKLQEDLAAITNGGSGLSLLGLSDAIKSLKGILLAVANYNEEYTVNSNDPSGLEPSRLEKIKIIQEIIDIKSDIEGLSELIGGNPGGGGGSITLRVKELETQVTNLLESITRLTGRIDALEEEAKGHAHLDTKVLDLMPADFGTDNQTVIEKRKSLYKTLKISEYPPTSAKFLTYAITSDTGLYYLGFLPPVELNNRPDFYPFGHTDSNKGYPLFYVTSRKADGTPAGYAELTAAGQPNKQLYAGDGTISGSDYVLLIKMIYGFAPEYASTPDPSISENLKYEDLYIDFNGNKVPVGDVNLDGEVTVPDVNTLINTYNTNASSHSMMVAGLPATYSKNLAAGYLLYQNPTANNTYVLYPCIEGKVYVDTLTGNAYSYSDNKMYPVAKDEFVGSDGILIKKSVLFTDDENLEGPYNLYKISIADDTLPNTITCKYINDLDAIDNEENFEYFLYEGLYLVIPSLNWDLSNPEDAEHVTIDSTTGTVTVTNNISSVTSLIDVLLGSNSTISLKETIGSKKQALTDWVNSKLEEALLSEDVLKELKLTKIKNYLTGTSNTHTSAPSDPIKVYYGIKIGSLYELRELSDLDPYYERLALKALWDFDQNGSVNISDITSLIDSLLNTKEESVQGKYSLASDGTFTYITPIALGANIWKKIGENKKQVVPAGSGSSDGHKMLVDGRLFRVIHPTQNVNNLDWYYFDDNDVVRPINPKLDLDYSSATGYLSLHQYGVEIDNTQISTTGKNFSRTTSLGGTYEIRNLGENSKPYLFGTWTGKHLPCFLNPDMSVIKDAKVSVTMDDISRLFSVDEILDKSTWFDKNSGNLVLVQPSGLTLSLACPDVAFTELKDYSMLKYVGTAPYTSDFTEKIRDVLEKHIKNADFSKSAAEITAAFNTDNEYTSTYWGLGPEGYLYKVLDYIKVTMSEEALSEILSDNSEEITNEVLALILLEAITLNANMTIIDSERLDPNTIYYFPKFGLQIRFEVELVEREGNIKYTYHPVIVQVESKEYDKNHVFANFTYDEALTLADNTYTEIESLTNIGTALTTGNTLRKKAALVYPNEHLGAGRVDSIYFDCSRLENIPGFKYIDAHGSFIANIDNMSLTLGSSSIGLNNSNPIIRANRFYEYHIFNGVFSFKDISTFSSASSDSPQKPHSK